MIEGLVRNPFLFQLPFGPFVPVQAQLGGPWRIAAHFEEHGAEVGIVNVEVVVVHLDRLVAREQKFSVDLLALEGLRLLLRHSDKDDPILDAALFPDLVG